MENLIGKKVECISMKNEPRPVPTGTSGVIKFVDGIGQLHVDWDNGRSLALIPGEDEYNILN